MLSSQNGLTDCTHTVSQLVDMLYMVVHVNQHARMRDLRENLLIKWCQRHCSLWRCF